ncbi:MAG: fumarylacetoacetate hydrolase family protein [Candidatus Methanomethylophilaceae archaeon]|jgi:2-keto-4-pentenoate hydratase/2-oxohepta-3-ene-1,7-dioic acid hydratase in catechol pathway|nr:fumarylacetoacetate hydrolase family protein [Candidatus Methanomethylophilaceae archaeon]NLF33409.1 fumarylacetoacetate hydrolase family protein [Thermoplasmatales archaeon]
MRPRPGKIISIGWNYRSHLTETEAQLPSEPVVFFKAPSCLIGDGEEIRIPKGMANVQHEVELALIFGKTGKDIHESEALSYISKVAVFNDITARDLQDQARKEGNPWAVSKSIDTFGPISKPVPIRKLENIQDLRMELTVNGKVRQTGRTSLMVFTIPKLVSYVSKFMTIEKGDIMITGTPEGVSEIVPGDVVCAKIDGVGSVTNRVV